MASRWRASLALGLSAAALALPAAAATAPAPEGADGGPVRARYDLDLRLGRDGVLAGTADVSWVNAGPGPAARAWLRLWADGPGGCRARRIRVRVLAGGRAGPPAVGCTALPVTLDAPLPVGARGRLRLAIRVVVPRVNRRFGRSAGGLLLGNALPVLAVRRAGGPDLDPYIGLGDPFLTRTSHWRARLSLPADWRAATTGQVVRAARSGDERRLEVVAPRARDFAVAAGPYRAISAKVGGVRVRYLAAPGSPPGRSARMLRAAVRSVRAFSRWFGPYRARELEVVETPGLASHGMEYPGLVMSEPLAETVVHEVAHQWWYAQVGSDGWRAPWLDETLTTWSQLRLIGGLERCDLADPLAGYGRARLTWSLGRFAARPAEYPAVYDGGACAIERLRDEWGTGAVNRMLRGYSDAHMFGIATTDDLVGAIARAAPPGFDGPAFLRLARIDARWPGAGGTG